MLLGTTIMVSSLGYTIWCFLFVRKAFLSTIFLIIKVHSWHESNLDSYKNLNFSCDWALQSCSPNWDAWDWCFGFVSIAFLSTIFLIIKVQLWNESDLDFHNNLHTFCYGHYNHVHLIRIHNINDLIWQEKLFFPPFPYN